jgi:hypothetical protein
MFLVDSNIITIATPTGLKATSTASAKRNPAVPFPHGSSNEQRLAKMLVRLPVLRV